MSSPLHRFRFRRDHRWAPGQMSAHLDGELAARAAERLHRHVRECPECRELLRGLQRMLELIRGLPPVSDRETPAIVSTVMRRLHETSDG